MDRQIEFRGKLNDGSRWMYGSLDDESCIWKMIRYHMPDCGVGESHKTLVDESTIGQYIMIDDINGNKVFEGDIIKVFWEDEMLIHLSDDELTIYWDNELLQFRGKNASGASCSLLFLSRGARCEVIGNIYEAQIVVS